MAETVDADEETSVEPNGGARRDDPAPARANAPARSGGRLLAAMALLAAIGAAALSGAVFWFWQAAQEEAEARGRAAAEERAERHRRAADERQALREEQAALRQRLEQQAEALVQREAAQRDFVTQAVAAINAPQAEAGRWRLAEVEHLARLANYRLLMARDVDGARNLLALADEVLAEAKDPAFHDLRAQLAKDQAALGAFKGVDTQGVFLRLEAQKAQLERLPLRLPEYVAAGAAAEAPPAEDAAAPSLLGALRARLAGLVRFRRHDAAAVRPLLAPRRAEYLQQRLGLALDRAQLAVLRHDQAAYAASLTAARDWLRRFVDRTKPATRALTDEIDALLAIDLNADLPDIRESLAQARALLAQRPASG